ncbi:putative Gamma-tubulin complex component 6 [Hypsibius exemplaris]|uniref:Gamma-tubulin complex component n=1 Tax=Hypsibius exemplaris TaxID=2072580 RepID=A0A1W0X760_HYPEX|nr:putative Gamma-tubulin complex component 6 [Hypsibius exemplaris]
MHPSPTSVLRHTVHQFFVSLAGEGDVAGRNRSTDAVGGGVANLEGILELDSAIFERAFWDELFHIKTAPPDVIPMTERINQLFIDAILAGETDATLEKLLQLVEEFRQPGNSTDEAILNFLLDLRPVEYRKAVSPGRLLKEDTLQSSYTHNNCLQFSARGLDVFEMARSAGWRIPEVPPFKLDLFAPKDLNDWKHSSTESFAVPCGPIEGTLPLKTVLYKPYVGRCLSSPQLSRFLTLASLHQAEVTCDFSVTALVYLTELANVATGMDSMLFHWMDDTMEFRLKTNLCLIGYQPETRDDVACLAATMGTCVRRIRRMVGCTPHPHLGTTFTHFIATVKHYLETWISSIKDVGKAVVNLLVYGLELSPFLLPIQFLQQVCNAVIGDPDEPIQGLCLLQLLYDFSKDVRGTESLRSLSLYLLEESAKPFFDFATALAILGEVRDPYHEFGIIVDEHLLRGTSKEKENLWDGVILFQDPSTSASFLSEFIESIVRAAKAIILLRLVTPSHPLLPSPSGIAANLLQLTLSFTTDPVAYQRTFKNYRDQMRHKMDCWITQPKHVSSDRESPPVPDIKTAPAIPSFAVFAASKLTRQDEDVTVIWHRYNGCLTAIVQQQLLPVIGLQVQLADTAIVELLQKHLKLNHLLVTIKSYFFLEDGHFSVPFVHGLFSKAATTSLKHCLDYYALFTLFESSLAEQAAMGGGITSQQKKLTLMTTHFAEVNRAATSFDVSDYLGLQYDIEWPLSMIITPPLIRKCNAVFRRFLRVRGCTWALNDAFIVLSEWKGVENDSNRCLLSIYRHEMAHFIRVLDNHLMDVAVSRPWIDLQARLTTSDCFETIRDSVAIFLTQVYDLCIVDENQAKKFFHMLNKVFELITRFYTQLYGESSFDNLQKTFHLFQHCVRQIRQYVLDQSVPVAFDAASFLAQMDFSGYILSRTTVPAKLLNRSLRNIYGTL